MRSKLTLALGTSSLLALVLGAAMPASADLQPNPSDVVGVGSDTVQYVGDFLDNGASTGTTFLSGFNSTARVNKIFNFDATADAAGTAQYGAAGRPVPPASVVPYSSAIVLRAGGFPVYRPQGSGDGIKTLLNDTVAPYAVDFVRASRLPKAAENTAATTAGFGGLHSYQIATDGLDIAVNNVATTGTPTTCSPAVGLTVDNLLKIYQGAYQVFSDIPGYQSPGGNCNTETIALLTPDEIKSGTGSAFFGDLKIQNGGVAPTRSSRVTLVEEHDPSAITGITAITTTAATTTSPAVTAPVAARDAVEPFSTGRYNLIQTGYFDNVQKYNKGTVVTFKNTIALQQAGSNAVATTSYGKARFLYIVVRENDITKGETAGVAGTTAPFLPGGTQNFVRTFFAPTTGYYSKPAQAGLFTAAGVTQAFSDLGNTTAG